MRKLFLLLSRTLLLTGVLVALTPCGFCQKSQVEKSCALACAGDHACCQHKKTFSVCPIMDQSSETGVVQQPRVDLALAPAAVISQSFSPLAHQTSNFLSPLRSFHRSSLVLRI
jgi:hypothetical protein